MESIDVRRIMKKEAIKSHLITEVLQLKKKINFIQEEHVSEIENLTDKYYDECERKTTYFKRKLHVSVTA